LFVADSLDSFIHFRIFPESTISRDVILIAFFGTHSTNTTL